MLAKMEKILPLQIFQNVLFFRIKAFLLALETRPPPVKI